MFNCWLFVCTNFGIIVYDRFDIDVDYDADLYFDGYVTFDGDVSVDVDEIVCCCWCWVLCLV